jgi:nitrogen fixation protein FixH
MIKALTTGPFTGRHFAVIIVSFFAVVVAVNLVMARYASATFGGVVVENSYVASQKFNGWLEAARREAALGWTAEARRETDGSVAVTMKGDLPADLVLKGEARHPLGREPDRLLSFRRQDDGRFVSGQPLPAGRWKLRLEAVAGARRWRSEQDFR